MTRKIDDEDRDQAAEKRLGGEEPLIGGPGEKLGVAGDGGIAREPESRKSR